MKIYLALLAEHCTEADAIRAEHDPLFEKVPLHLTLVFPTDVDDINDSDLTHFFAAEKPMTVSVRGVTGSHDNLLFLTLSRGNDNVIDLHHRLYTQFFPDSYDPSYTFFPHLTVGRMNSRVDMLNAIHRMGSVSYEHIDLRTVALVEICADGERKILRRFKLSGTDSG